MSHIEALQQIEARHGVTLPPSYRELAAAGYLDIFGPRDQGRVLELQDMEWFPLADIVGLDRANDVNQGLLPFAQDGAGCVYGFDDQLRVCYAEYAVEVRAPDFGTWLYQELIRLYTWNADPNVATRFGVYATMVRPYLTDAQWAVIEPIAARTPERRTSGEVSVLTPAEARALV